LKSSGDDSAAVTLDELQATVLRPGEVLVDFLVGEEKTVLFVCTREELRAAILPGEDELGPRSRLFYAMVSRPHPSSYSAAERAAMEQTTRRLAETLFTSNTDLLSSFPRVIVAPDGVLNLVPFSLLLERVGSIDCESANSGERSKLPAVTVVPSATVLARLRSEARHVPGKRPTRIMAVAGRSPGGARLGGVMDEVRWISRRYRDVTVRIPAQERELDGSTTPPAGFDVLHFAGHSRVDDEYPWRSSIMLAGASPSRKDAVLQASEIAGWALDECLVVMASCESARGRILSGEGVQGLSTAFLCAGVPVVVAALWPVDDRTTASFMREFYEALESQESVSGALRAAGGRLENRPETAHPFYWAGFVAIGDADRTVDLETRGSPWPALGCGVVAALLLWAFFVARGKTRRGV
jgi:hypothetical protein